MANTMTDIMPGCYKVAYGTKGEAKRELKRVQRAYAGGRTPQRVYVCRDCGKWHLTSSQPHTLYTPRSR